MSLKSTENPPSKFHNRKSLEQALLNFGISKDGAQHLSKLGRTSLHLTSVKDRPVFSKIGGVPDLPNGTEWPIRPSLQPTDEEAPKGIFSTLINRLLSRKPNEQEVNYRESPQPYNFIVQISFSEMASIGDPSLLLPDDGALYLFYDDLTQCWGFDPMDSVGFRLIYAPSIDNLKKTEKPRFIKEVPEYKETFVEPTLKFEHSLSEGLHFEKLQISESDKEAYIRFDEQIEDEWLKNGAESPEHKVRGWSNLVQNPMEEECALVTSRIDCGGPEGYNLPEAKRIMAAPNDWVQLLQIDSDDGIEMMWGDTGMLYLWIKKSDLEKRNFENTWLILQCH